MNEDLKKLLLIGGILGVGYFAYNYYSEDKSSLTLNQTYRIAQQIKHQMLTVTISFYAKSLEGLQKLKNDGQDKQQLVSFFQQKLGEIYRQKQKLILDKYNISFSKYLRSLKLYEKDQKLQKIISSTLDAIQRSANGQTPDLTVDKKALSQFGKLQAKKIYEEMSKMVLVAILGRLQEQKKINPSFDGSIDSEFKRIIKGINMFEKKTEFFKQKGIRQQWGHPNEVFLKITQQYKISDGEFNSEMIKLEEIFDRILDQISKDPASYSISKIYNQYTQNEQNTNKILSRSAYHPKHPPQQQELMVNRSTRSKPEGNQEDEAKKDEQLEEFFSINSASKLK